MKKIILISLGLLLNCTAIAHENPDIKGVCANVVNNKLIQAKKCVISSGGGAGGMYTVLNFGKTKVHIEESTMCPEYDTKGCNPSVGRTVEDLEDGQRYYRDYKTGNIIKSYKDGNWSCAKRNDKKVDACYLLK